MAEGKAPAGGPGRMAGSEPCGCRWEKRAGIVVFLARCGTHRSMCRSLEDWELALLD